MDPEAAEYALDMIMKPLVKVPDETETDLETEARDQEPDFPDVYQGICRYMRKISQWNQNI